MTVRKGKQAQLKVLLDDAYDRYARPDFIGEDPIQIPRSFTKREDAEIIGFLAATIAWGQRKTIIANARKLAMLLDQNPHDFVLNASPAELKRLAPFVHRTFNGIDLLHFVRGLRHVYATYGGLENAFLPIALGRKLQASSLKLQADGVTVTELEACGSWLAAQGIALFKQRFFEPTHQPRTQKHVADPGKGSNAKRINMFLRWMVRPNDRGVDLGLWKKIRPADLMVPLDVHTGRVARELGLLSRKQDDWKAVEELTAALRKFDALDPVRYDIALFSLGVMDKAR